MSDTKKNEREKVLKKIGFSEELISKMKEINKKIGESPTLDTDEVHTNFVSSYSTNTLIVENIQGTNKLKPSDFE